MEEPDFSPSPDHVEMIMTKIEADPQGKKDELPVLKNGLTRVSGIIEAAKSALENLKASAEMINRGCVVVI